MWPNGNVALVLSHIVLGLVLGFQIGVCQMKVAFHTNS